MRSRLSAPTALLFLLSILLLLTSAARAADDTFNDDDEYEEHARVLRVSLLKGEVSLKRAGNDEWEEVRLNMPLVEGDVLATGRDSRFEIQADARNFIRVGPDSVLRVVTLRDEGIAISVVEGTATVRLAKFDRSKNGYFEIDAPKTTMAAEKEGLYRIDVIIGESEILTVRDGGAAVARICRSGILLADDAYIHPRPKGRDQRGERIGERFRRAVVAYNDFEPRGRQRLFCERRQAEP